jgi:cell wall-associated NlpC family hydrolase
MTTPIRLFPAIAIACLALAPAASADYPHNYGGSSYPQYGTNGGSDPSDGSGWDNRSQWDGPSGGSGWNGSDPSSGGWSSNNDPVTPAAPTPTSAPTTPATTGQGDPQESPKNWTNGNQDENPFSNIPALPISKTPTVPGKTAMLRRNGLAAIPKGAPAEVRAIIAAANQIIGKPYKWGGGHGRLFDSGYDCSGSVSYALIRSGLLAYPMVSGSLAHWGAQGVGKYVTIYANKSHVYMEVAGMRLDTSPVGDPSGKSGVRWRPVIGKRFGFAVRHIAGI